MFLAIANAVAVVAFPVNAPVKLFEIKVVGAPESLISCNTLAVSNFNNNAFSSLWSEALDHTRKAWGRCA